MTQSAPTRRKRKKRSIWFAPVAFIIICAALVFAMSVFFSVSHIEVVGSEAYTTEEIISASGVEEGDNLFFINSFTATSRIFSKLPYVEECTIERKLPNTLLITVVETRAMAYFGTDGKYWVFDRYGKILYETDNAGTAGLIRVRGLEPEETVVGEHIELGAGESYKTDYLCEMLSAIWERGMAADVTLIDITNGANPEFDYLDRFTVRLGSGGDTANKFDRLLSAIAMLTPEDRGILDLSIDKEVHITPD